MISSLEFGTICAACGVAVSGIAYAIPTGMELLRRLCAVIGISLVLTLLLLVLYQDDGRQIDLEPAAITQATTGLQDGRP